MKILVLNCGSSTLKFHVFDLKEPVALGDEQILAYGLVDRIGSRGEVRFISQGGGCDRISEEVPDHGLATQRVIEWLRSLGLLEPDGIQAIGHRIVHGGHLFRDPTPIDERMIDALEALRDLAPLHNEPALRAIRTIQARLGSRVPMMAVFDTAFHADMPDYAARYALPEEWVQKHRIRRYGFHGLAHRYMMERFASMEKRDPGTVKLITLQLGNGSSAAAIAKGRSVDTSMGFTPLEGLMMGTRSGDVDPHLPIYLAKREGMEIEEVDSWLNRKSGLLGVSGLSADMRELLEAASRGHEQAALAIEMFTYRVKKQIGAYLSALGGAEAILFGGGIGENAPAVRSLICQGMEWCGLLIDEDRNRVMSGQEGKISADDSSIGIYVIPVNEAILIARDTIKSLQK